MYFTNYILNSLCPINIKLIEILQTRQKTYNKNKLEKLMFYVIIRGSLGIGKSTIAKELAKKIKGEYISIDQVLEENKLDKIDKKLGCISCENFIKANEIALPLILKNLENGKNVVIDGNFYHKEQLDNLIKNLGKYKKYVFTLKATLETCIERDKQREKSYGEGAATAVFNLVSRFDSGINIDSEGKKKQEVLNEIYSHIFFEVKKD
jgi:shikimate kinase